MEMVAFSSKLKLEESQTPFPRQSTTCLLPVTPIKVKALSEQVSPDTAGAAFTSDVSLQYRSRSNVTVESEQAR